MGLFSQRVVDGVANGAIYAALALALVLIFRSTGLVNFAQGEMAMFATFLTWYVAEWGLNVWGAVLVSIVVSMIGGAAVHRLVIRPVERADPLSAVIVMVGLFIGLNALGQFLFGPDGRAMPGLFPDDVLSAGGVRMRVAALGVLAVLLAVCLLLWLMFRYTGLGLALRAVASNPESSGLCGLPTPWLLMTGWALAAGLGALAGALLTSLGIFVEPNMMLPVLIYSFGAATLGGFGSPAGAVVGGIVLGVVESLAAGYIPFIGSDLKLGVAFVVIVVVMLVRPHGLFGRAEVSRA